MDRPQRILLALALCVPMITTAAQGSRTVRTITETEAAPAPSTSMRAPASAVSQAPVAPSDADKTRKVQEPATAASASTPPVDAAVRTIASVTPVARTVCPEGTHVAATKLGQIRQVGQDFDQVISGEAVRSCTTAPLAEVSPARPPALVDAAPRHSRRPLPESDPNVRQCVQHAAQVFGIHQLPLYLILDVEGGTLGKVSANTNGTYDIGPAQINSWWLPTLAKAGISEDALRDDLCTNVLASGWIYAQALRQTGNMAKAIALYHSPTPKHQYRYLGMIDSAINRRLAPAVAINNKK
jgi:Transglycosylase SLT domain.